MQACWRLSKRGTLAAFHCDAGGVTPRFLYRSLSVFVYDSSVFAMLEKGVVLPKSVVAAW
jgi:hypothetical protein